MVLAYSLYVFIIIMNIVARGALMPVESMPKMSNPVWSLATLNEDGYRCNYNIQTYANSVSVKPSIWSLSLYKGSLTHKNFFREGFGALQLLKKDCNPQIIELLGKMSGSSIDKVKELGNLGINTKQVYFPILDREIALMEGSIDFMILMKRRDGCEIIDAGDHDLILCDPIMYMAEAKESDPLTTGLLRQIGVL